MIPEEIRVTCHEKAGRELYIIWTGGFELAFCVSRVEEKPSNYWPWWIRGKEKKTVRHLVYTRPGCRACVVTDLPGDGDVWTWLRGWSHCPPKDPHSPCWSWGQMSGRGPALVMWLWKAKSATQAGEKATCIYFQGSANPWALGINVGRGTPRGKSWTSCQADAWE